MFFLQTFNLTNQIIFTETRHLRFIYDHVIWTERRMSKLVLNVKYWLLLPFLTEDEFYNL